MQKVSVILTTYNSEDTIDRTIRSIINQEGKGIDFELELIVVDDCSSDRTVELISKYELIIFSTGTNSGGPNRGRNIGLQYATGDFFCIADHDDEWKPERIRTLLPYLEGVNIVTSGHTVIKINTGQKYDVLTTQNKEFIFYDTNETFVDRLKKSYSGQNTYLGSMLLSSCLKDILFEEHFGMVDYDWLVRVYQNQSSIEVCKSLYSRYVGVVNLSLNEYYRRVDYYYSLMFAENYEKSYPKEVRIAKQKINGTRARYYYMLNNMKQARYYFRRSKLNFITVGYYLTTFLGSNFVRKRVRVFG